MNNKNLRNFIQSQQLSLEQAMSQKLFKGNWIIGNLDGVHLGHTELCKAVVVKTEINGLITFKPHPRRFFSKNLTPFTLTGEMAQSFLLKKLGIDYVITLKFNKEFSELSPKQFVDSVLIPLKPRTIVVGENFYFGKNRLGTSQDLKKMLGSGVSGVKVKIIPLLKFKKATNKPDREIRKTKEIVYSSSLLREALAKGNIEEYQQYSNQYPLWVGKVIKGDGFGSSKLDMPTLNIRCNPEQLLPTSGIYIASASPIKIGLKPAIMYIGNRPSLDVIDLNKLPDLNHRCEIHILDENIDWRQENIKIKVYAKLRNDKKFPNLSALKTAMHNDADKARIWWQEHLHKI